MTAFRFVRKKYALPAPPLRRIQDAGRNWKTSKPPTSSSKIFAKNPNLTFLNTFDEMLGPDGKPKPDIFVKDNLHMNPKGYAIWTPIVREFLEK